MAERPVVVLPLVWKFAIDGLTRGCKFLVDYALEVEKQSIWT
jgi:hypothetical protein